jgi:hypothetical protein
VLGHDPIFPEGENLAVYGGTGVTEAAALTRAVDSWYNEMTSPGYNFDTPGDQSGTGHFTQVN